MRRLIPDPFALAILLTLLVMAAGAGLMIAEGASLGNAAWAVAMSWIKGSPPGDAKRLGGMLGAGGLAFALQMSLVLVTGHALALSAPVQRGVRALARVPKTTPAAAMMVACVACATSVLHWGLGAIVGALLAREVARAANREGRTLNYPLLGGAAYAGFAVWHGGLSGSAPLTVASDRHFLVDSLGVIDTSRTLWSTLNIVVTLSMVVVIVALFGWLGRRAPHDPDQPKPPPAPEAAENEGADEATRGVAWLQQSRWVGAALGLSGGVVLGWGLSSGDLKVDLGTVILAFLFLGMALQGGLSRYAEAVADGARGAGGIILQFPFYFGILGVMKETGLIAWISSGFASIASATTFPVLAFLSAGLINFFVPSGGGQWAVQGELLGATGAELGVDPAVTVMAFAYGDAWTNMLQPFWALPLLGIMGLRARDVIGYTAAVFIALGLLVPLLLLTLA